MKKISVLFVLFAVFSGFLTTRAETIHLSKTRLNQTIDSIVKLQWEEGQPGGVIAILSQGNLLTLRSYGLMNAELRQKNDEKTLFDIASVSKQFTAYAILTLEKEGKLNLDEKISRYLPGLHEYGNKITTRQLLQHTSGVASTDWLKLLADLPLDEAWTQTDDIALIKKYSGLNFEPNSQFVYSNGGYSLLAEIVKSVSGMTFSDYLEKNVFRPAGMKNSFVFDSPQRQSVLLANGYKITDGNAVKESSNADCSYGGGNIRANMKDMVQWGKYILSDKNRGYLERIGNSYNTLDNGDTIQYTYGFYVRKYKGLKMVEHSGGVPGFRNQFMIFPGENMALIIMNNNESINSRRMANSIIEVLFAGKLQEEIQKPREEIKLETDILKNYEGRFRLPDGMEMTFTLEENRLWLLLPGDHKFELFPESRTKFFLRAFDAQCTFVMYADGTVNNMIWHQGGRDFSAQKVEETAPLTGEQLAFYAGNYIHADMQTNFPVIFANGKLSVQMPGTFKRYIGIDNMELNHVTGDKFATDRLGMVIFMRDNNGKLNGFMMPEMGRLQNVTFVKQ